MKSAAPPLICHLWLGHPSRWGGAEAGLVWFRSLNLVLQIRAGPARFYGNDSCQVISLKELVAALPVWSCDPLISQLQLLAVIGQ